MSSLDYGERFDLKGLSEMLATKGMRFPIDVILVDIRWYAAYSLSYRHLEEMMQERGGQARQDDRFSADCQV